MITKIILFKKALKMWNALQVMFYPLGLLAFPNSLFCLEVAVPVSQELGQLL